MKSLLAFVILSVACGSVAKPAATTTEPVAAVPVEPTPAEPAKVEPAKVEPPSAPVEPEPAAGEKRTVVTQGLMVSIASGKEKLADFVDAKSGVVFIDNSGDPGEKPAKKEKPSLKCGKKLTAMIAEFQKSLADKDNGVEMARSESRLTCSNKPTPTCTLGAPMEWSPALRFIFRVDAARGVVLRGIVLNDEAAVAEDAVEQAHTDQAATIEKLTAKPCP